MTQIKDLTMMPETIIEFPMKRPSSLNEPFTPPINASIVLTEELYPGPIVVGSDEWAEASKGEFKELQITVSIFDDDPRFKAFDVYTQYSGICSVVIKHAPHWFSPAVRAVSSSLSELDDSSDRTLAVGGSYASSLEYPVNYIAAVFVRAHSLTMKASNGGKLEIGMCKGNDSGFSGGAYTGTTDEGLVIATAGDHRIYDPESEGSESKFALESHNPLSEITFTFTDEHPIPFASYNLWGYFDDSSITNPVYLAHAVYQPDHLKVGKIISRTGLSSPYTYNIKTVSNLSNFSSSLETVTGCLMKYEIGRWVLMARVSKSSGGNIWKIVPTSFHYWKDVVDYFRKCAGEI